MLQFVGKPDWSRITGPCQRYAHCEMKQILEIKLVS